MRKNSLTSHAALSLVRRLLIIFTLACAAPAFAGRACEESNYDPKKVMQALEFAHKAQIKLDESKANVAIIARVGQDLSKYNLRYSHLGLIERLPDGTWSVMHELNQCGTASSELFREGLGNFFMDDMFAFETLILIPNPELQLKIQQVMTDGRARNLHAARYNMLAYAYSTTYQNSNQWALEVIAAAQANDVRIENRTQAQAWLKSASYKPDTLQIPSLTRLGARMFRANVAFDDHPFDRRMAGQIDTVTVESIVHFMMSRDSKAEKLVLK
ncbi:DUF2145 domain-containing protein [Undibacterium umbellatum]|uniref:DUF2145 domain-containing protein n=1 Tax=Undibacterium umbellatum TaxID=2762300 RepID=A0ABR6Z6W6_9BURK|nr:DUF2145 domain-containing protein [Undibacterium umbellatum]MBC3907482.1 DUF2145 domain-containing protein [Undibacterium umbellatum]